MFQVSCFIESTRAIYDIGTKTIFGASVSRKPIKNWEIEDVKVWFWKLSTCTIIWHNQNVIWSHSWKSKNVENCFSWFCRLLFFSKIPDGGPTKPWNLCVCKNCPPPEGQLNHETKLKHIKHIKTIKTISKQH